MNNRNNNPIHCHDKDDQSQQDDFYRDLQGDPAGPAACGMRFAAFDEKHGAVYLNADGKPVTTSYIIAQYFGKTHSHVLRAIRDAECSDEFIKSNFGLMLKTKDLCNRGHRKDPFYEVTRDGFFFVCMGFTGRKAARMKEHFIICFNEMEARLRWRADIHRTAPVAYERDRYSDTIVERPARSATSLLNAYRVRATTEIFNILMTSAMMLEEVAVQPSHRWFKRLVGDGLAYGFNIASPDSPDETWPVYYLDTFPRLCQALGLPMPKELTPARRARLLTQPQHPGLSDRR